jgi:hypothetical protein
MLTVIAECVATTEAPASHWRMTMSTRTASCTTVALFALTTMVAPTAHADRFWTDDRAQSASTQPTASREISITARDIRQVKASDRYVIDLTKKGIVYRIDANVGATSQRISVRAGGPELTLASWVRKYLPPAALSSVAGRDLRIGSKVVLSAWMKGQLGGNGGSVDFTCSGLSCTCAGIVDCSDLFRTGLCGDIAACWGDNCSCLRV